MFIVLFTEDTNPGKPKFVNIEKFPNAILVRWLPPDDAGVVCVTEYHLGWGKNTPYQFNSKPLSSDETQYLIKDLRKYSLYFGLIIIQINYQLNCQCNGGLHVTEVI